jgi:predicted DNA-binding transcriptional regulator AlpA
MFEDDHSPFLTIPETAQLLRVRPRTLDNLRWSRKGPPARRHGGRIVYHRSEVLDWSALRRTGVQPAKPPGGPSPRPGGGARTRHSGNRRPASKPPPLRVERKR